jgi:hypothetical protein
METITSAPLRSPRPGGAQPHLPVWLAPNKEDKNNIQDWEGCGTWRRPVAIGGSVKRPSSPSLTGHPKAPWSTTIIIFLPANLWFSGAECDGSFGFLKIIQKNI